MLEHTQFSQDSLNQKFLGDQWPVFSQVELNEDQVSLLLDIPEYLSFFAGHFPEQAVLPGVVQIHWAGELAKFLFDLKGFAALKNIKFNSMVLPNKQITLSLKYNEEKQTLRFDYTSEVDKYSSGVLVFTNEKKSS